MNFIRHTKLYFLISALLLIPGLYSLSRYGLRLSIDFTGGTLIEIQTSAQPDQVTQAAKQSGLDVSSLSQSSDSIYLLRVKPATQDQNNKFFTELKTISQSDPVQKRFETVGPSIGKELTQKAILSLVVSSLCIVAYIAWTFRHIPRPYTSWKFGVSAVIALLHDALVVLGLFSIFGHYFNVEIDSLFVTALLTVIGFSVHDTIVVFDRVRENLPKLPQATFSQVVDFSLAETLGRSLNTSLTVILTLSSLLIFGGETIRWFVVALLIGIISGTYSSIFNAAPILVLWEQRNK
jgi:preprotein translocase subunit SecF